jgi:transcription initiation factor TFIID subunit 1, fungi type
MMTLISPRLEAELFRLEKNKERREQRNISKNMQAGSIPGTPISASAVTSTGRPVGTQRKCANCGRIGHIKTNKKCVFCGIVGFAFTVPRCNASNMIDDVAS